MIFKQIFNNKPSFYSIWKLSWPIILANLTIPIVTATDTAVMGQKEDAIFIAAIALGGVVFSIVYFSLNFLRMSTTGLAAQERGKENIEGIKNLISLTLSLALAIGIIITIFSIPLIKLSQFIISSSISTETLMSDYIYYRSYAAPATLMNMVLLGVFIGIGAPKSAMLQLIFVSLLNAILSIYFVLILNFGIIGVALGTVIAQWAGWLLSIILLERLIKYDTSYIKHLFNPYFILDKNFKLVFGISRDFFIRTLCIVFAEFILINNSAKLGNNSLAVIQIYLVFLSFVACGLDSFAHSAETLLGNSIGKKDKKTSLMVIIKTLFLGFILALIISILLFYFGENLLSIFTSIEDILSASNELFPYLVILPLISVWAYMLDGFFVGASESNAMRNSTILAFIVFIIINYFILFMKGNIQSLWISYLIFLLCRGIFLSFYFKRLFHYNN